MHIQVLLFAFLLSALSASCQSTSSKVTIPAQQTFMLGEYSDFAYKAKLTNKGSKTVTIQLRNKSDQSVVSSLQLSPKQSESVEVTADQLVAMKNATKGDALIVAKMSKKIYGMSYVGQMEEALDEEVEIEVIQAPSESIPEPNMVDANATSATEKVTATVSGGQALVLGEGTSDQYSADLKTIGGSIKVSIRDRNTGEQTQGFGLGNAGATVNIRPNEVIYLLSVGAVPAVVSVGFSKAVSGMRKVAI